jgi:hypothetical protein
MKVIGDFNNISTQLKPKKLKKGEVAIYRYLGGSVNTDPDETARKSMPIIWPEVDVLWLKDRIYDPYKEDFVEIGIPSVVEKNEVKRCQRFEFFAKANKGDFYVNCDSIEGQELYEFLELSNKNESNPNRDEGVTPWFKRIDLLKEAKERTKARNILGDAILFEVNMSDKARREYAAAMGRDELADIAMITDQIKDDVFNNPDGFLKFVTDEKGLKERGVIKSALTKDIIRYDVTGHKILWVDTNTTIAALDRVEGKDYIETFYDWILTSKSGQNVFTAIQKKLNAVIAQAVKDKE